ncbi:MAG: hypothetical protein ACFFDF_18450 [Candidatus Odinarchaeota archaeon]
MNLIYIYNIDLNLALFTNKLTKNYDKFMDEVLNIFNEYNVFNMTENELNSPSNKNFKSWFDYLFKKVPAFGKLLSSLWGVFELYILEFLRRLDKRFKIYSMGIINKYLLRGCWGGKVVPMARNIDFDAKFIPSQEMLEIAKRSNVAGISWCYCRSVQRKYEVANYDHPIFSCIHLSFGNSLYEIQFKSQNLKKKLQKRKLKNC